MQQESTFQIKKKPFERQAYMLPLAGPHKRLQNQRISLRQSPTEASQTKQYIKSALAIDKNVRAQPVNHKTSTENLSPVLKVSEETMFNCK